MGLMLVVNIVGWIIFLIVWVFVPSYFKEKGKNLATKEDIGEITTKIEEVKSKYSEELENIRSGLATTLHQQNTVTDLHRQAMLNFFDVANVLLYDALHPSFGSFPVGDGTVRGGDGGGTFDDGYSCESGQCVQNAGWEPDDYTVNCRNGMCLVPAGSFWMGCNSAVDMQCTSGETPYHEVTLSGYYMDKTEVTVSAYGECVTAGACTTPSTDGYSCNWNVSGREGHPVNCITWAQSEAYCAWAGKRLPTEAEWEKAARGTDGRKFPWGNEDATCDYAVMYDGDNGCGTGSTWDVCGKSPSGDSPYGLCDMAGNVREWVSDWLGWDYYGSSSGSNPTGPDSGSFRVARGGSVNPYDGDLRVSNRTGGALSDARDELGFRCARPQ